jgi:hypothetical protein
MRILPRRRYVRVDMNCACPEPASPVADPTVKQQFVERFYRVGGRPLRLGCDTCGVKVRLTTTREFDR